MASFTSRSRTQHAHLTVLLVALMPTPCHIIKQIASTAAARSHLRCYCPVLSRFHIKITNAARAFDSPACGTHAHTLPHNQTDRKHCRRSEPSAMLLPGTVTVSGKRSRSGLIVQWPKRRSRPSGRHAAVRKVISSNRTSVAVSIFKLPRQPTGVLVA